MSDHDVEIARLEQKIDSHIREFDRHRAEEDARWEHLITVTEQNSKAIHENAEATRDIVEIFRIADGTVKAGAALGRFTKWVGGLGLLGAGIMWVIEYLNK